MEQRKIRSILKLMPLMCAAALFALTPLTVQAQDFYGEGNVLIAVDLEAYGENENVSYPEGTMGELIWGADAPEGVSTRAPFNNRKYNPGNISPVKAPGYETETTYTVGQKLFLPFARMDDPDYRDTGYFTLDTFPSEVYSDSGPDFLINRDCVDERDGVLYYWSPCEKTEDGSINPCVDFLEIECVAVTEHSTIWQYTGNAYSNRTGFDIGEYGNPVGLTDDEIAFFTDTCDRAYKTESEVYGDPLWEDNQGDRDKKAAYVALDVKRIPHLSGAAAFYLETNTDYTGFDCLFIGVEFIPGRDEDWSYTNAVNRIRSTLTHELNHYIVNGCIGHEPFRWNMAMGEAFAEGAVCLSDPENPRIGDHNTIISEESSGLQMIPGILWNHGHDYKYPIDIDMIYAIGAHFLRYIERETTGRTDGRLWTEYFAGQTPSGSITADEISAFLQEKTGEPIDAWLAQFMAAIVVGDEEGIYSMADKEVTAAFRINTDVFFRSYEEYGKGLGSFDSAADTAMVRHVMNTKNLYAVQGGGTTYAFRNDAGGRISITGADERWYFIAVDMDFSPKDAIEIANADELARIGNDPGYPLSGSYILTADIDLGGEEHPWTPIGTVRDFSGEFNGNGHSISGLYINTSDNDLGLFACITANAVVRDLTVRGEISGNNFIGGIVGMNRGGTVSGCSGYVTLRGNECVGGITGYNDFGTVTDCTAAGIIEGSFSCGGIEGMDYAAVTRNCSSFADVTGVECIGGISGGSKLGLIDNCANTGNVSASAEAGGITGLADVGTAISNCRNTGIVSGNYYTGGIAGLSQYAILEDNHDNSPVDVGLCYREENGRIVSTEISPDSKVTVSVYKVNSDMRTVSLKKLDSNAINIDVPSIIPAVDNRIQAYTVTSIAKGAFKNTRNASIVIPGTVDTLRANTFSDTAVDELIFIVNNAAALKIKPGAFNNMKKQRKTTISIWTSDKAEFDRVVENFKKAGGNKFRYEFRPLNELGK